MSTIVLKMSTENKMIANLFPKTKRSILALILLNPDEQFYIRQIEKLTGISQGALQRELKSMVQMGLLNIERRGHQAFYSANRSNPIYAELRGIVYKTFGVSDVLILALKPLKKKIKAAFIYGSIAKGEETGRSDIDLMVIGKVDFGDIALAVSKAEKSLGREINPNVFPVEEYQNKMKTQNHFLNSVIKAPKIMLIGSEDDIRRLG